MLYQMLVSKIFQVAITLLMMHHYDISDAHLYDFQGARTLLSITPMIFQMLTTMIFQGAITLLMLTTSDIFVLINFTSFVESLFTTGT